jgi:hypothetical protein
MPAAYGLIMLSAPGAAAGRATGDGRNKIGGNWLWPAIDPESGLTP